MFVFFFKQKTAYEMRISDWSSDVCSSDLGPWKMTRIANAFFPSAALLLPRQWQLYNIDTDRGETTDVAAENPEQVEKLTQAWAQYVERVDAINPTIPPQLIPIDQ